MKQILIGIIIFIPLLCKGQLKIPEAEFIGDVYCLLSDSTYVKLDKEEGVFKTTASASMYIFGMGDISTKFVLRPNKASHHFINGDNIILIIKGEDNNSDPFSFINIFPFEVTKKERKFKIRETATFSGVEDSSYGIIKYEAHKYAHSSYILILPYLKDGEYGIMIGDPNKLTDKSRYKVATFGINNNEK